MPAPAKYTPAALRPSTSADPEHSYRVLAQAAPEQAWTQFCVSVDAAMALDLFSLIYGSPQWRVFEFKAQRFLIFEFYPITVGGDLKGYWLQAIELPAEPQPAPAKLPRLRRGLRRTVAALSALVLTCVITACEPPRDQQPARNLEPAPTVAPTVFDPDLAPLATPTNRHGDPDPDPLVEPQYPRRYARPQQQRDPNSYEQPGYPPPQEEE